MKHVYLHIPISVELRERMKRAALDAKKSMKDWITGVLERECGVEELADRIFGGEPVENLLERTVGYMPQPETPQTFFGNLGKGTSSAPPEVMEKVPEPKGIPWEDVGTHQEKAKISAIEVNTGISGTGPHNPATCKVYACLRCRAIGMKDVDRGI